VSRSNPTENASPNPATRWFEWNGELGNLRYYDKTLKKNIDVPAKGFTFILLDQLGSVGGFNERSQSGITSNEVKDTRSDVLLVKSFKGGEIAHGLYKDIKDKVNAHGGKFKASCYIAFKDDNGELVLGNLGIKGGALTPWLDFTKENRAVLYDKGIQITGFTEHKKGKVDYRNPTFRLIDISESTNAAAVELDKVLQAFLKSYLGQNKRDQVETTHLRDEDVMPPVETGEEIDTSQMPPEDDIPF
jgi:hypothetical protein